MSDLSPEVQEEAISLPSPVIETAGSLIRKAREATGLHIAALAVSLKVSVKKLEALESDRLDLLPDPVFVRGLASSVCRTLKTDPVPILALLPITTAPLLIPDKSGINAPFKAPGDIQGQSAWSQLSRPVVLAALVLLCAALVLIFFPTHEKMVSVSEITPKMPPLTSDSPQSSAAPVAAANSLEAQAADKIAVPLPNSPELTPTPAAAETANSSKGAQLPSSMASTVLPNTSAAGTLNSLLVFSTRSESWVEVTDAKGVVQLRTIILPGQPVKASGAMPLSVVVGRADATEVLFKGRPYAITGVSKDNVARFEVK